MTRQFFVQGTPIAQGSMIAVRMGARSQVIDSKANALRPWRKAVAIEAAESARRYGQITGPVAVDLAFLMPRPKSARRALPAVKPDIDKLTRAVLDALTQSGLIEDDGRITDLTAQKRYGTPPGVLITVRSAHDLIEGINE